MKILYILHTAKLHGSSISLLNLILNISKEIIPIIIIPKSKNNELIKILVQHNIKFYRCHFIPQSFIDKNLTPVKRFFSIVKIFLKKILFFPFLYWVIKKEKPSIIHTNVGVIYEGYKLAKILNIPHVWHIREYQDKDFNWKFFYGKNVFEKMLKNSYVICITKDIRNYFNLNNRESQTIYNGIYHCNSIAFEKKDKYYLCASRIAPNKGQEDAIKAFAKFHETHQDWKLIIAGEGEKSYVNKLKDLSQALNCQDSIKFIGFQNAESIFNLMKKAAALIVASQNEGFGRMTAEACFAGTLIIGRYTGGTKEILDMIEGYRFLTESELEKSMIQVSKEINTTLYNQKIRNSQKIAQESFSIEQNITKTLNLYKVIRFKQ